MNNARGAIMDTQAVVDACNSGHIAGSTEFNEFSRMEKPACDTEFKLLLTWHFSGGLSSLTRICDVYK